MDNDSYTTRRTTVQAMEDLLYKEHPVLDHGFVRVVDYMGGDSAIVQAARVSYGKGTKKVSQDRGLIRYLLRRRHTTPFEMCELKLHVKLPIFVARQWIRHRTANVNEYSARYSILDKEFYLPAPEHTAAQSQENKQGRETVIDPEAAAEQISEIERMSTAAYVSYEMLLNENAAGEVEEGKTGLARELARMVLPTNYYTQWYWKIDLHNLLHFIRLRADEHAQYEIREYARVIGEMVKAWVPLTWEAFEDYVVNGLYLSAMEAELVSALLRGADDKEVGEIRGRLSAREWKEFNDKFNFNRSA